jgi:hypothetical protein
MLFYVVGTKFAYRRMQNLSFSQIHWELMESQQFESVARNECVNPIWQSHVKNTISLSEATRSPKTVASLSFNLPSEFRSTLFEMCSQHVLTATRPLAWDQGPLVTKNGFLWVRMTHRKSHDTLGMLGKPCERTPAYPYGTLIPTPPLKFGGHQSAIFWFFVWYLLKSVGFQWILVCNLPKNSKKPIFSLFSHLRSCFSASTGFRAGTWAPNRPWEM